MNEPENSEESIEAFLESATLAGPSRDLDHRMAAMLRRRLFWPQPLAFAGTFAAGALVMLTILWPRLHPAETPAPAPTPALASSPTPVVHLYAQARQVVDEFPATIDGIPVRLQRTQHELMLYHDGQDDLGPDGQLLLPATYVVSPVPQ